MDSAIIIFTRNRPETLRKTLNSVIDISYTKYIVDDSTDSLNQESVRKICNVFPSCIYLGKIEFNKFINKYHIEFPKFSFLLREMGNIEWNLGYARNFALLYSKSINLKRVLFVDDDIHISNLSIVEELFQATDNYQFAGAKISGLVDDSILGHIATDIGIINEKMLSGGFLAFSLNKVDCHFLNNYNEDWIWLFLQLKNKSYLQIGEVFQELSNPLANYNERVLFQEFGEIAIMGVLEIYEQALYNEILDLPFWEKVLCERLMYIDFLVKKSVEQEKHLYSEIIEYVKSNYQKFEAIIFRDLFKDYFSNKAIFELIYKSFS